MNNEVHYTIEFTVSAKELFKTLMDEEKHSAFTHSRAIINPVVGGKFSTYDNYIEGCFTEIVQDKRITQKWKANENDWPDEQYSEVIFDIEKTKSGCRLSFHQYNLPDNMKDRFVTGWQEFYWEPLQEYFNHPLR